MAAEKTCDEELIQTSYANGRFVNPFRNTEGLGFKSELDKTLPVLKPDKDKIATPPKQGLRATWIGHATVLIQMDGISLLTDPIFSTRCSPLQWLGTKRYRDPALTVPELPHIDAVVISHNHYDHLDEGSVKALNQRFGKDLQWYVPMGLKACMTGMGCSKVNEMKWWEEHKLMKEGLEEGVTFAFTPAHHWCKRVTSGTNKVLWGGWAVIGPKNRFFFAGDTAYCNAFTQIGQKYGPFTLAAIPIGAYESRWFMKPSHIDPEEAVQVHIDIRAERSLGIHWGTFGLSYEFYLDPPMKIKEEIEKRKLSATSFYTTNIGEVTDIS